MLSSPKERLARLLNSANDAGMTPALKERIGMELQVTIERYVRPVFARKVRGGPLGQADVDDLCQEVAAGFMSAVEKERIFPDAELGLYTADTIGRYLHQIAVNKLTDIFRRIGRERGQLQLSLRRIASNLQDLRSGSTDAQQRGSDHSSARELLHGRIQQLLEEFAVPASSDAAHSKLALKAANQFLVDLDSGQLRPAAADHGLYTAEHCGHLLSRLAAKCGLKLVMPATTRGAQTRGTGSGVPDQADDIFEKLADSRTNNEEADERLWQQIRAATGQRPAQELIIAYLSFAGASHKAIAHACGVHINTVTNCVQRVVLELRSIMSVSGTEE